VRSLARVKRGSGSSPTDRTHRSNRDVAMPHSCHVCRERR
jgi:hypothetical protein